MLYTIKITNKNVDLNSPSTTQLYLDGISPSLISNLTTTYEDFMADMVVSDTSLYVPLYKRNQVVKIPESSVLIISTDNSSEAVYYRSLKLNNSFILVDPDPITKSSSDPVLIDKYISENGVYHATDDGADGYSTVNVDVSGGSTTLITKEITSNGTYDASSDDADGYSSVSVDVPNTYTQSDEGKVVQSGALISQTSVEKTVNGTYDTTTNNSVVVNVANSYTQSDEGKVVSNGTLVAQGSDEITENGVVDTTLISSLTVNVSGGGGGTVDSAVNFYDYDGTIVNSYSAAEFAQLNAMPTNPSHTGLVAQGWNWTLADAKSYVASYGKLNIGQMYTTSDGKTRLYFTVTKDTLSVELNLELESDTELDVDWGDGSEHTRWTSGDGSSSQPHTYASAGRYVIAIEVITGEVHLSQVLSNIFQVRIGNGVASIGYDAFNDCSALSSITISSSVTSIGEYAFRDCYSLSSITIPDNVTYIGDSTFHDCYSLSSITIPDSVTDIGASTFYNCSALSSITIPDSVTGVSEYAFYNCSALSSITIPNSVTDIGYEAFQECYALSSITIPNSVTSINSTAFFGCSSLSSITIPDGVTSIDEYTFQNCYSLSSVTIPGSVTSIGSGAFHSCYSLSSITIPDEVTSISDHAFQECYALLSITFESSTPPELDDGLSIPVTCIIRVPQGSLSDYTSASNYPDPSIYIYEEY